MRVTFLYALLLISSFATAQSGRYAMGARQAAMAGTSVTLADQWAVFNNPGALGNHTGDQVFVSYQNRYGLAELSQFGVGYVRDFGKPVLGVGFYRFGGDLFNEQRVNLAAAHKLDRVSLGVSVDYLQYAIATVGSRGVFVLDFGGVADLTEQIRFGAHIFNLSQTKLVKETGERIPTVMKAGLAFTPIDELTFQVETEKDLDFDEVYRIGLEYRIIERVHLRTGFSTAPFNGAFGFGLYPKKFQFEYAFVGSAELGAIHELSVSYDLTK